jgi:hypothetical protein
MGLASRPKPSNCVRVGVRNLRSALPRQQRSDSHQHNSQFDIDNLLFSAVHELFIPGVVRRASALTAVQMQAMIPRRVHRCPRFEKFQ